MTKLLAIGLLGLLATGGCSGSSKGLMGGFDGGGDDLTNDFQMGDAATAIPPLCDSSDPDLRACYDFDEETGTVAADGSGHGLALAIEARPAWTLGRRGSAIASSASRRDGLETAPDLTPAMTVEAWFNIVGALTGERQVGRFGGSDGAFFGLAVTPTSVCLDIGVLERPASWTSACYTSSQPLPSGRWVHVAIAFQVPTDPNAPDAPYVSAYVDGIPSRTRFGGDAGNAIARDLALGPKRVIAPILVNTRGMDVDMVRIYSRALSDREICAHAGRTTCAP